MTNAGKRGTRCRYPATATLGPRSSYGLLELLSSKSQALLGRLGSPS